MITYGDSKDFDFRDSLSGMTMLIRMNGVGILACLEDSGTQQEMFQDYFADLEGVKLHPVQFEELAAKMTYKSSLLNRVPKYVFMLPGEPSGKVLVVSPPLQGFSLEPVYGQWDMHEYAQILAAYWAWHGFKLEDIDHGDEGIRSLLGDKDGAIPILDGKGEAVGRKDRRRRNPAT